MVVVFGFNVETEDLKKMAPAFLNGGVAKDTTFLIKRTKESLLAACSNIDGEVVVVLNHILCEGEPYSVGELDALVTAGANVRVILVISSKYKGTEFMHELYSIGVYDACYVGDDGCLELSHIVPLVVKGRGKVEAKEYYGVSTKPQHVQERLDKQVGSVIDLRQMIDYIENDATGTIDERIEYVSKKVSRPEFLVIMKNLSETTKGELIRKGGYELYYAQELPEVAENAKNSTVGAVQYVNINEAIGVVGLTRECGSTFVALNLARQLADVIGESPSLIQLPHTGSDLYERLSFSKHFGGDYCSHFSEILRSGIYPQKQNLYSKINFIVENPLIDEVSAWDSSCTLRLLLAAPSPKVVDFGTYYNLPVYREVIPGLKHLLVVVDGRDEELTEEDIRQVKDIAVAYSGVNVSVVVNRCERVEDTLAYKFIDDDLDCIGLPIYKNRAFEVAGCDILYPNVREGLSELASLVGFTANSVVKRESKDKKDKNRPIELGATIEIGVAGVARGVGTTQTAIMLAMSLKKKYKVAIVEQNDTHSFANLYRRINPSTPTQQNLIGTFTYKGVDFYPLCNYSSFVTEFRDDYDVVIVDCGIDCIANDNFARMTKKIVCASSSEWRMYELSRFYEDVRKKIDPGCKFNYVVPLVGSGMLGSVRKVCSGSNVYAMPYSDAFVPSDDALVVLGQLVNFGVSERKWKGFFSRKGK